MGGRVKYKTTPRAWNLHATRRLGTRQVLPPPPPPPPPPPTTSPSSVFQFPADHGPLLNKSSIIWISILSAVAIVSFILVLYLLFHCKCGLRKKQKKQANGHRYHPSQDAKDGRNEFEAWNKSGQRVDSLSSVLPLARAAVRPAGTGAVVHPGNPVVVDEVPDLPVQSYGSGRSKERYYSGFGRSLKRFSSIGKAY